MVEPQENECSIKVLGEVRLSARNIYARIGTFLTHGRKRREILVLPEWIEHWQSATDPLINQDFLELRKAAVYQGEEQPKDG